MHHRQGQAQGRAPRQALKPAPYAVVIFDFDGTLADTFPFVVSMFNEVAHKHGLNTIAPADIEPLRHRSTSEILRHLNLPWWRLPLVTRDFIQLMRDPAAPVRLFDGVPQVIDTLHGAGVRLGVVSSNSADNVARLLGPALMAKVAHVDGGVGLLGKAPRIRRAARRLAQSGGPPQAIYVGDQLADLAAARRAGVAFGAVSWG